MSRQPATTLFEMLGEHGYVNVQCRVCRREAQFATADVVELFKLKGWVDHYQAWGRHFTCLPPFGCGTEGAKVAWFPGDPPMGVQRIMLRARRK